MITNYSKRKLHIYLFIILFSAAFLRLWGIWSMSLQDDGALYSTRALGWFDYLVGSGQTSPIVWFGYIPWWANLSFHDHPPVGFLIQRIFFILFGDHTWVALLPHALAGIGTAFLLFLLTKKFYPDIVALLASAILAVSAYTIWIARLGFLEAFSVFFITLSTYWFLTFIQTRQSRYLYGTAAAVALALLTKYTSLFLFPAIGISMLIFSRETFRKRDFWLTLLFGFVLLSPVIFYNYKIFLARGHFDAALSSLVGMSPADYAVLSYRNINAHIGVNFLSFWKVILQGNSFPLSLLYLASLVSTVWSAWRRKIDALSLFSLFSIVLINLMFLFTAPSNRFLAITAPFFAILSATAVGRALSDASVAMNRKWLTPVAISVILAELGFSINTHIMSEPLGITQVTYATNRINDNGFERLDRYLRNNAIGPLTFHRTFTTFSDKDRSVNVSGREVILFDERANWFSRVWYVDRYNYYYSDNKVPFLYFSYVLRRLEGQRISLLEFLHTSGVTGAWIIFAPNVPNPTNAPGYSKGLELLEQNLKKAGMSPETEIKSSRGETLFRIYHIGF